MAQRISTFREQADRVLAREVDPQGAGLAIVVRSDGQVVYEGHAGMADIVAGRAIDGRTAFELASLSKPITAMAVLTLVDRGIVSLGDPVRRWIPELPVAWPTITIHDLLSQQSGLPDFMIGMHAAELAALDELTNAGVIERLRQSPSLLFAPESQSRYSNTNYVLLAEVVTRAARRPFADYVATDLFAPAGLVSSFAEGGARPADTTLALDFGRTHTTNGIHLRTVGPTGIYSSADDLSRLLQALIDGRILTPGTLQKMISPEASGAVFDDGERYGYGWALPPAGQPVTVFAHRGDKDGFRTIAFVDTRHRLDYVILCNGGDAGVAVMNHLRALFERLLQPAPS